MTIFRYTQKGTKREIKYCLPVAMILSPGARIALRGRMK